MIGLCLLGCSSIPGFESDSAGKTQAALQHDTSCAAVAAQRAQDAAYSGYDRDMQRRIDEAAYAECLAGRRKSGH